ncbi:hypothetical protein GCM10009122_59050 [Fulvivirga kasyanovii]|uniref:hypothetical protein n=1 Tax=Fulvivirga kasyanovii TaxID=396812 RepID=UPI0031D4BFBA
MESRFAIHDEEIASSFPESFRGKLYLSHRDDDRIEMVVIEKLELEDNPNITVITRRYDEVIPHSEAQMNYQLGSRLRIQIRRSLLHSYLSHLQQSIFTFIFVVCDIIIEDINK